MSQPEVIGLVLAMAAAFFAGRGYERVKLRYVLWRADPATHVFGRRVRNLALVCLLVGVAVIAVQAH